MKTNLDDRIRAVNDKEVFTEGEYILYWMIATRRLNYNASLEYAAKVAEEYGKPLLVIEEISTSHKFANDRITSFVIQGMVENINAFREQNIRFIPWVETPLSGPMGLLKTLAKRACLVVTDDFPTYYPLSATKAAGKSLDRKVIAVDSNGVFPMSWTSSAFSTAHSFRRFIHANFSRCRDTWPKKVPLNPDYDYSISDEMYQSIIEDCSVKIPPYEWLWRCSEGGSTGKKALSTIDIDHNVQPVRQARGGVTTASKKLAVFLKNRLHRYNVDRNNIEKPSVSGLSPWLHFGHISSIEIVSRILDSEKWTPENITTSRKGSREGW